MYVGSAPSIEFIFPEHFNVSDMEDFRLTLKNGRLEVDKYILEFMKDSTFVDEEKNSVTVVIPEEETTKMKLVQSLECQFKYRLKSGIIDYTNLGEIDVERVLNEAPL